MIKVFSQPSLYALLNAISKCINNIIPNDWRRVKIVQIPKVGKSFDVLANFNLSTFSSYEDLQIPWLRKGSLIFLTHIISYKSTHMCINDLIFTIPREKKMEEKL